jgi:hypothetical protein
MAVYKLHLQSSFPVSDVFLVDTGPERVRPAKQKHSTLFQINCKLLEHRHIVWELKENMLYLYKMNE